MNQRNICRPQNITPHVQVRNDEPLCREQYRPQCRMPKDANGRPLYRPQVNTLTGAISYYRPLYTGKFIPIKPAGGRYRALYRSLRGVRPQHYKTNAYYRPPLGSMVWGSQQSHLYNPLYRNDIFRPPQFTNKAIYRPQLGSVSVHPSNQTSIILYAEMTSLELHNSQTKLFIDLNWVVLCVHPSNQTMVSLMYLRIGITTRIKQHEGR